MGITLTTMFGGGGFSFGGMGGGGMGGPRPDVDTTGLYKTLGVAKNATASEIKKAYRKLAVKHHPDKGGDPDTFKEISKTYDIVGDEEKRTQYDQFGEEGVGQGGGGGQDIFDMFLILSINFPDTIAAESIPTLKGLLPPALNTVTAEEGAEDVDVCLLVTKDPVASYEYNKPEAAGGDDDDEGGQGGGPGNVQCQQQ